MSKQNELIEDFLEADDNIRGQNFVCLSFISPENVLRNKELFFMQNFLHNLVKKNNINLDDEYINNLEDKYKDFLYTAQDNLDKEFSEKNDFQTTVRGIKVRGVYDTQKEAEIRAKVLQRKDKNFNVFVGQVGFWLPWDPTPHKIENQEYFETELNQLVKKYNENQEQKQDHFRENIEYVTEQAAKKVEEEKLNKENLKSDLEKEDPWLASKNKVSEIETL
jgi:hypothetical protein